MNDDLNGHDMNSDREKMKAVCFPEREKAELIEVPLPEPGDEEVLVRIAYSAISPGTERWMLRGKLEVPGEAPFAFPHVPGYQAAGTIVEVGPGVTGFAPGDRVFSR
ncbi:MAG: alcohol dehydrogenase catalytic domain-containing protein, partial [Spirochaetia bacterium]